MGRKIKADYSRIYLLPPSIEDWVPEDHPARFIRDFVESLDMKSLGFRIPDGLDGRPAYSAEMLLMIWLYGYMHKIRSSRKLEGACLESLSLIWLTGCHYPGHNTLWRFWSANRRALRGVFRQVLYVALKADLIGLVLHAVDGTKIAADVSTGKVWRRGDLERMLVALEGSIDEVMGQTEALEGSESGEMRLPVEIQDSQRR
jgi:transposase